MKVIVIGLDGMSWGVLNKIIKDGELKALKEIVDGGCKASMRSIVPPVSEPAWISMATGLNPGKTGVIDFLNRVKRDEYRLIPVSSTYYKEKAIWDIASMYGLRVGVVNYPLLYPPYEVNGYMISGIGATDRKRITYPPDLIRELNDLVKGYEIDIDYMNKRYDDLERFFSDILRIIRKRKNVITYLLRTRPCELFFAVLSCTDWVLHLAWRIIDPQHPLHDKREHERYYDKIISFFSEVDELFDDLLNLMSDDTILFIVSDHGFGPHCSVFNLYAWLKLKGYLVEKRGLGIIIRKTIDGVKRSWYNLIVGIKYIPDPSSYIDFSKSIAFCLGHTIPFGGIYLSPYNNAEFTEVKRKLMSDIKLLEKQLDISIELYDPKEMYSGVKLELLPDLIMVVNGFKGAVIEDPLDKNIFSWSCFSKRHTGSHRLYGIFLAYGTHIKRGAYIEEIQIYDVAPTILHVLGLPIPGDVDGRVLKEIFKEGSPLALRPIYRVDRKVLMLKRRTKHMKDKLHERRSEHG